MRASIAVGMPYEQEVFGGSGISHDPWCTASKGLFSHPHFFPSSNLWSVLEQEIEFPSVFPTPLRSVLEGTRFFGSIPVNLSKMSIMNFRLLKRTFFSVWGSISLKG